MESTQSVRVRRRAAERPYTPPKNRMFSMTVRSG